MAVAYESSSTTVWTDLQSGGNLVIPKPTGLTVGDYMVAHLSGVVGGSPNAAGWDTLAGWTSLVDRGNSSNLNSSESMVVFYKIADSGDVAATDFTFTKPSSDNAYNIGTIWRVSGATSIAATSADTTDDTTPNFTNTITPSFENSLILFLVTSADADTGVNSVSGYAITNNNPSWTELYDVNIDESTGADRGVHAGAYASRTQNTATGDSTCVLSKTQNNSGAMIVLSPVVSPTITPTVLTVTASIQTPTVTGNATISPTVLTITATIQAPTINTPLPTWSNQTKNNSTWNNQDKT